MRPGGRRPRLGLREGQPSPAVARRPTMGIRFPAIWVIRTMGGEPWRVNDVVNPLKEADMPSGIYPVPPLHQHRSARRSFPPSLWQRLRTWWGRDELDEQLARGFDREATPELRLRAAQLVSSAGRVELANAVETVGREARGRQA